jgi:hypothetical protein
LALQICYYNGGITLMVRSFIAAAFLAWLSSAAVPQAVEFHRLTHNGRVLDYALILADRFDKTTCYPVLLAWAPQGSFQRAAGVPMRLNSVLRALLVRLHLRGRQ